MAKITLESRAEAIAYALGNLQDQARVFANTTKDGVAVSYQSQQLARYAVRFVEEVRRASRPKGDD